MVPFQRGNMLLYIDGRNVGTLARSRAVILDQEVEAMFGAWQIKKIEGAWVLRDHGVTVPALHSLPPRFTMWERNNPMLNLSHCHLGLCYN